MSDLIESFNNHFSYLILVVGLIAGIVTISRIIMYIFGG